MTLMQRIQGFRERRPFLFHGAVAAAVVLLAVAVFAALMATRSRPAKRQIVLPTPRVRAVTAVVGPTPVRVSGEGTVTPLRSIDIVPQVGGRVIEISPSLVDGGHFMKGDVLLRIDPVDYQLAVENAVARVKDAESRLLLAEEEVEAAREEWRLQTGDDGSAPPPLVAKEPQLDAAKASLEGARADLDRARLNLDRTVLRAPFEGRISEKLVDLGQIVGPNQRLGRIFSVEAAEISVPLENETVRWIRVPRFNTGAEEGNEAIVRARVAGRDKTWEGRVMRAEGLLDERTRMINVVVRVDRPYDGVPPLAMGLFVEVDIVGETVPEAAWLPRGAIRNGSSVYVIDPEGRLRFRDVEVARYDRDEALVTGGLADGEIVVVSSMKVVTDGMKVNYELEGDDGR